jgi:signal transduction histidine kinase
MRHDPTLSAKVSRMDVAAIVTRSPLVFPLACVAAVAMVFISEGSYWQAVKKLDKLGALQVTREHIQGLERSILDAESGQRGYLLTGRAEYLTPYENSLKSLGAAFVELDQHYRGVPDIKQIVEEMRLTTDAKLSEMALTIRLHDQGEGDNGLEIVRSNIGKEQVDSIRAFSAKLLDYEDRQVASRRNDLYRTLMLSRYSMAALSALSLLALFLFLRQATLYASQQAELKRSVQTERDRLDVEVKHRTAQLTELTQHLQTAREDERNRLARNLHDELGALLTSAKLDAARIKSRLAGTAPEALERLAHLVRTLNSSIALGRRIIEDLRPSTLSNLGLVPTLEILAREFTEISGVEVNCDLAPVRLTAKTELVVYRLVQEAITNISKYAQARQVWISLAPNGDHTDVSVRDDGVGFDTRTPPISSFGLLGMRFRVEAEGGTLRVVSAPGQGTRIEVRLPSAAPSLPGAS